MAEHPLVSARGTGHPPGRELFLLRCVDLGISEIASRRLQVSPGLKSFSRKPLPLVGGTERHTSASRHCDFYSVPRVCCLIWINLIDLLGRFAHDAGPGARVTVSAR